MVSKIAAPEAEGPLERLALALFLEAGNGKLTAHFCIERVFARLIEFG